MIKKIKNQNPEERMDNYICNQASMCFLHYVLQIENSKL